MAKVFELETKNGRIFRVLVENDTQEKRLFKIMFDDSKNLGGEELVKIHCELYGIHSLKQFEDYYKSLQSKGDKNV